MNEREEEESERERERKREKVSEIDRRTSEEISNRGMPCMRYVYCRNHFTKPLRKSKLN